LRPTKLSDNVFFVSNGKKVRFIPYEDIIRCESRGAYTTIHTSDGETHLCSKNLGVVSRKLLNIRKTFFIRVHKSHLVNIKQIKAMEKPGSILLIMSDGSKIPVAGRRKTDFLSLFTE